MPRHIVELTLYAEQDGAACCVLADALAELDLPLTSAHFTSSNHFGGGQCAVSGILTGVRDLDSLLNDTMSGYHHKNIAQELLRWSQR